MAFKKTTLAFEPEYEFYIPSQLVDIPIPALRKEYTRLRDIEEKRMKRLAESEFKSSDAYKYNVGMFPKLDQIKDLTELTHKLSELSRFINLESSTVTGQKAIMQRRIDSLASQGFYVPENKKDQVGFFKFVDYMKEKHGINLFYHVSEGGQKAVAFDDKLKAMISKGDYDAAYERMNEIKGDYEDAEEEDYSDLFEID